jgi:hypothetical protein
MGVPIAEGLCLPSESLIALAAPGSSSASTSGVL